MLKLRSSIIPTLSALAIAMAQAPVAHAEGVHVAVRVKSDPVHAMRWELGWGDVFAYDEARGFVRRISLADASFLGARGACRPGLDVSRTGAAIISSNAEPVLWRIDPDTFEVRRYDVTLNTDLDKDFGFSSVRWSPDERIVYAASAMMGTLWRIDLASKMATKIGSNPAIRGECGSGEQALAALR